MAENLSKTHPDIIDEPKSTVGLTDDQAKAVADALCQHHGHGPQEQGLKDPA